VIEDLVLEVKRLAEVDPQALADSETIVALHRATTQLEAIKARATAAWDASQGFATEHRTAAAWLATRCHIPKGDAVRTIRLGRACRALPVAEAAWLAGDVTSHHVGLLASKRSDRTAQQMRDDEEMLVDHARRLTYRCFARALAYWHHLADEDGVERDAVRTYDERNLHVSVSWRDTRRIDGLLDPIGGSIVETTLQAISDEMFKVDWAEAKERLGEGNVTVGDLCRTPAQRRADALVEMATRARTAPKDGRRPAPLFSVFVGWETFAGRLCELADGPVVTPGSLVPWLTDADVERVVFDSPSRVLDVSTTSRFFTGATRRAAELRDLLRCNIGECDEPGEHVDHIIPASMGGPTTLANARMGCAFHNQLRNRRPQGP
jgi:hypothetical protein